MRDDLFEQIDKEKEDLPKVKNKIKEISKYHFNFYQQVAILIMIIFFFAGIILGNVFPSCQSSRLYGTTCTITEFNVSLTIIVWFIGFLVSMFTFWLGHVIHILNEISRKLKK